MRNSRAKKDSPYLRQESNLQKQDGAFGICLCEQNQTESNM